jgi:hypothetical protein
MNFKINFKAAIYFTYFFTLVLFLFNSTFPKKNYNWVLIWIQMAKLYKIKIQWPSWFFFKKNIISVHNDLRDDE